MISNQDITEKFSDDWDAVNEPGDAVCDMQKICVGVTSEHALKVLRISKDFFAEKI